MAPTKIVVVGGSYAGIAVINELLASKANQKQEIEITLIERQVCSLGSKASCQPLTSPCRYINISLSPSFFTFSVKPL